MVRKAWSIISQRKMRIRAIMKGTTENRRTTINRKIKRMSIENGRLKERLTDISQL
jgi:hypothetical protein